MRRVAFVLKGYPRLSETFIAQEIRALELRGLDIRIISLRHPTESARHPVHGEIQAEVSYLPEYLYQEPLRVLRAWWAMRREARYPETRALWLRDLRRDPTPNRVRRFGQALVLAWELPEDIDSLHAHFLHTPASVTRYAAQLTSRPWSCSAHAKDVWTTPEWEIAEKLAECTWLVTCNGSAETRLAALAPAANAGGTVSLIYHGLDLARFPPPPAGGRDADGSRAEDPVRLLSVGRAVAKKGYGDVLTALARLPAALAWRLEHIGGGPELKALRARAERLGLASRITWRGALAQAEVLEAYRRADLFVLASRIAASGDRDGLPNVLMEAQSQAVACLASAVAGIPELIRDGETGRLVPPERVDDLAGALEALIRDPDTRRRLGRAGQARLVGEFDADPWLDRLAERFAVVAREATRRARA